MAEEQQEGFLSKYLPDLVKLLGAGATVYGASKVPINTKGAQSSLGVFLAPDQFKKLGGARSMHPAVAAEKGYNGNLFDPKAIKEQQAIDNEIFKNYSSVSNLPHTQWDKLYRTSGWGYGPQTGFGRVVSDQGMKLKNTWNPNEQMRTGQIIHPAGNMHSALNLEPINWTPEANGVFSGPASYRGNRITLNDSLYRTTKPYWFDEKEAGFRWPSGDPGSVAAHELQHAGQDEANVLGYDINKLEHQDRPWEWEARASQYSYLRPEAYRLPYSDLATPKNYYYDNFLDTLKKGF